MSHWSACDSNTVMLLDAQHFPVLLLMHCTVEGNMELWIVDFTGVDYI